MMTPTSGVVACDLERVAQLEQRAGPEGVAHLGTADRDLGDPVGGLVRHVGETVGSRRLPLGTRPDHGVAGHSCSVTRRLATLGAITPTVRVPTVSASDPTAAGRRAARGTGHGRGGARGVGRGRGDPPAQPGDAAGRARRGCSRSCVRPISSTATAGTFSRPVSPSRATSRRSSSRREPVAHRRGSSSRAPAWR